MASCMALKRSFEHDRDSNANSPSYESRTSSPSSSAKRQRRYFPMTVVSSSNETPISDVSLENQSVFPDVQPLLTNDALLIRIKEEVRRLQRRHQLKSSSSDIPDDDNNTNQSTDSTSLVNLPGHNSQQHLLTLKQVNMICARLLKEREEKIREEYDQILSNKLNEQYEGFVRFTQDQLTRRFSELQFSYVS
ncbi:unnamed protein product [Adineta ricciae]|uniref:Akirin n=1 Tax=Adineta ricciae TaxID=249248 RepID=A0A813Z3P2_ADIRI|nr:unnamed protein product [Adineta ricciae]CAF1658088.1 unnamed protein product [Adineta ricciae]